MKVIGIIPARYASTRFPGKPLAMINGKSMVMRVYEQAMKAASLSSVYVATDDEAIYKHVKLNGGQVMMTSADHPSGTDRCYEIVSKLSDIQPLDAVINIQGDEPYIDPSQIEAVAELLRENHVELATLVKKVNTQEELFNSNAVKVVIGRNGTALYFSRQALPFVRGTAQDQWLDHHIFYKHIGIYGYKVQCLEKIVNLPAGKLEQAESLEQLRWLENGFTIHTRLTGFEGISVDVPEDLLKLMNKY
jgi:3-deoxy-manno-octulosonate cytidylyltransferase (CMP-KDO synthetase)